MIKAIAIDDEPLALKVLEHLCQKSEWISLEKTFVNQDDAMRYLENFPVDLIFLDIEMPQKNGIDFYRDLDHQAMVIYTTAYDHYAVNAFDVSAVDYIMKPVGKERFDVACQKAYQIFQTKKGTSENSYLLIRADYKLHKIDYREIEYIEGLDDYIQIHLDNKPKIVTRMSMKNMLEKLPKQDFIRIHRSFILPKQRITSFQNKMIMLGDKSFPIGNTYKEDVIQILSEN